MMTCISEKHYFKTSRTLFFKNQIPQIFIKKIKIYFTLVHLKKKTSKPQTIVKYYIVTQIIYAEYIYTPIQKFNLK